MPNPVAFDITRSSALGGVAHGFFGHAGEQHQFGYGGEGRESHIRANRTEAAEAILPRGRLVAPHQVHSPDVIAVDGAWHDHAIDRPQADAVVTNTPGLVLGIVTADCAPVLFVDQAAGVIGAAHAGWRGAHGGVLENTVETMESLGARRESITSAIGPTIAQDSYEVDDPFRSQFSVEDRGFFAPGREGRWQFDLPAYILSRLERIGVGCIEDLALDTYHIEKQYYSYRRATHRGEPNYGRQISLIGLG